MENENKITEFKQRLDFYWQYITAYFVVLLIYGVAVGSIDAGVFTVRWLDPVVILLFSFMIMSSLFLLYNFWKRKSIEIGDDYIVFRARGRERRFKIDDIQKVIIGKKRHINMPNTFRIVKIKVRTKKVYIMFRPSAYWNDKELMKKIYILKQNIERKHK